MNHFNEQQALRVDIYGLLARLFRTAPNQELLIWLSELDVTHDEHHGMSAAWSLLKLSAQTTSEMSCADEYQDLFIGIGRGELVPYGSWYLTGSLMEMPLAKLRNDLAQLGFERDESVKEPEDNIAALLEVMAMLVESGNEHTQKIFFNRHIQTWFERFCQDLKQAKSSAFYASVGELALQFLTVEQTRFIENPQKSIA